MEHHKYLDDKEFFTSKNGLYSNIILNKHSKFFKSKWNYYRRLYKDYLSYREEKTLSLNRDLMTIYMEYLNITIEDPTIFNTEKEVIILVRYCNDYPVTEFKVTDKIPF